MRIPPLPRTLSIVAAALLGVALLIVVFRPGASEPRVLRAAERAVAVRPVVPVVDSAAVERERIARIRDDSIAREREREEAEKEAARRRANGPRLVISLEKRRLWWMDKQDTLYSAPVAVGKGTPLEWKNRKWKFDTPRGERRVIAKEKDPVWVPPLWHFVEHAHKTGRRLQVMKRGEEVELENGDRLVFRGDTVGLLMLPDSTFLALPPGQQVIFDETVFVPPEGTANRRVEGELGRFKLDMGDGYLLHGTRDSASIGTAATHGCIRLGDDDLAYLYKNIPVGTPVFIR